MPKYKIGDIVKWESRGIYTIDKIISVYFSSIVKKYIYEIETIVGNERENIKIGEIYSGIQAPIYEEISKLAIEYLKEKEFNKDLKGLIDE